MDATRIKAEPLPSSSSSSSAPVIMDSTWIKAEPLPSSSSSATSPAPPSSMDAARIKAEPLPSSSSSSSSSSQHYASPVTPSPSPPSAPPSSSANNTGENKFMIMGYDVAFPHGKKPFPAQLAVMNKVLLALKTGQHALLESPTGSGKTLALLCSSLTFQNQFVKEMVAAEKLRNEQATAAAAAKQAAAHAETQHAVAAAVAAAEGATARTNAVRAADEEDDDDDDDDFAATQPTFEQFRFANGATLARDGWISMDDKRRVSTDGSAAPAPPSTKARKLPSSFQETGKNAAPPSSAAPTKRRKLPSSFQEMLDAKAAAISPDLDFKGSMEDFHAINKQAADRAKRITPPKIFFCSRTHSQLAQVVEELKNCPVSYLASPDATNPFGENLKTCVLGSKSHYCVNSKVNRDVSVLDDKCREAVEANQCSYFRKRRQTNDLRRVAPPVWDLEDLVKLAKKHRECAFFHARDALMDANIVFCPYNYLLDPSIRDAVQISLKNAIIVLDEAHNVEDTCRSSASIELTTHALAGAVGSFTDVIKKGSRPQVYQTLLKILNGVGRWLTGITKSSALKATGFEEESNAWTGTDCLAMFAEYAGMTQENFPEIQQGLKAVMDYEKELMQQGRGGEQEEDKEGSDHRLSALAVGTIRGLLNVAEYMYRDKLKYLDDFKLIVMRSRSRRQVNSRFSGRGSYGGSSQATDDGWEVKLCIWCLNAAVAFSDVIKEARSVILTSGTLSPMDSFAGELGTDFQIRLEANHVVNIRRQVFIGAVMNGPGRVDLSATYKNQQEFRYQDSMGQLLEQYTHNVPGGILMFFPSYSLMDKLATRWKQTGVWMKIEQTKTIFTEPRKAGKDFDALLDDYKRTIAESMTALTTGGGVKSETGTVRTGAIFLAVYRGKVSEGIDFSNANARAVLAVGIPYPNVKELQVSLKRKYQDEKSLVDKKLVSGSAWYQLQAFRALNQALGRCIRHRQDYGAIILLDSRYRFQAHTKSLSKWIRPFVREFEHLQECVPMLGPFFKMNATELGVGIPVLKNEDASMTTMVGSATKKPIALKYEPDAEDKSFGGPSLQSTNESVRAYMAKRAESIEPQIFSIFAAAAARPDGRTPTPPAKKSKKTSMMRL